ncbi:MULTISPECIES: FG-GAP-like repeat-containing protein [unclassified Streptomyces]|uniref:FG-GAP-like repeat-containing protein n=1 Tax=unclassified Streptomyces TaxID=2593676 RepID=UPI0022562979|nr:MULTISPECIES: FG-GAP-like repeat-containing protein [unclassified Streptomyces]MCX4526377.1 FG-GAP-like repeat-containing protein [Streptomyces sp. NBC_01551]MCX4543060.1 FG-GAP-like repeat-containing protein [Streptomyces sp. NBC_01565]
MRTALLRGLATGLGLAIGGLGLAATTAAPAQAAPAKYENCPTGYFCAWTNDAATGPMLKVNTDQPTLGAFDNKMWATSNRTDKIACLYSEPNYGFGSYWADRPNGPGGGSSGPAESDKSSIKFVLTDRECGLNAYPRWYAETSPVKTGFGDLDNDRRSDVLVRDEAGRLWFLPGDGTGKKVGSGGWNGMSALTRHGDFTGDGKEDVVAREASTGKLWLYPGEGNGWLGDRKLIGSGGWNGMSLITAFGDHTGDGRSDVVARETSTGKLWLYPGTASGLADRVLIGRSGWGVMNALVGAGDMNGDGRPDLVARETSTGKLWLYPGTASGLADRVLIGRSGWNVMETFLAVGDYSGDGLVDLATVTNDKYTADGWSVSGHPGWLLSYTGRGNGLVNDRVQVDGDWYRLNGSF